MSSNYPPGFSGRTTDLGQVEQECENGHEWMAAMFEELGGAFYYDEEQADCPECGCPDIRNEMGPNIDYRYEGEEYDPEDDDWQ